MELQLKALGKRIEARDAQLLVIKDVKRQGEYRASIKNTTLPPQGAIARP